MLADDAFNVRRLGAAVGSANPVTAVRPVALGALCGLAWACGLRGFMTQVTTGRSTVTWTGTLVWVLVPGFVVGALLGLAEHVRRTSRNPRGRWLVWSPFALLSVVVVELVLHGFAVPGGGLGGGALAVPVFAVLGAYAIGGRRRWARILCGMGALLPVPLWPLAVSSFGGRSLAVSQPKGAWVALYFWSFLAVLMVATAIPLLIPPRDQTAPLEPRIDAASRASTRA